MKDKKKIIQKTFSIATPESKQKLKQHQFQLQNTKPEAILYVITTINNTFFNLTNFEGKTITKTSAGLFASGPIKKDSVFAALRAATALANQSLEKKIQTVILIFKGFGKARLSIATGLRTAGIKITEIQQNINLPHNGCRPRKKRRL